MLMETPPVQKSPPPVTAITLGSGLYAIVVVDMLLEHPDPEYVTDTL